MRALSIILTGAALLAACSSAPPATVAGTDAAATPVPAQPVATPASAAAPKIAELNDPKSPLAMRSFYFPYDDFTVDKKYDDVLHAHAAYIGRHPEARVTIEGNADERGSREYNLALGQKRAEAVKRILTLSGVAEKQVEAISYGKERPKADCHEESCWQQNRRDDLIYGTAATK